MQGNVIEGFQLSPQQRRRWIVRQNVPSSVQGVFAMPGRLEAGVVEGALRRILERHEILRTVFHSLPGMALPIQAILDAPHYTFAELSLAGAERLAELLDAQAAEPFDLAAGPTARFVLAHLAPDRHRLLVGLPALCADDRSLAILASELARELEDGADEAEDAVQYADFSNWLDEQAGSEEGRAGRELWRAQELSPERLTRLGFARRGGDEQLAPTFDALLREIPAAALEAAAEACGTTLDVLLLGAWQSLLWRLSGGSEVVVGRFCAGRPFEQLEGALGPFSSWVPVACRFDGEIELVEVLHALDESLQAAQGREELFTWEDVAGFDGGDGGDGGIPGFPILYAFEEWPEEGKAGPVTLLERRGQVEPCELLLRCVHRGAALTVEFRFRSDLMAGDRIEHLADSFAALLEAAAAAAETAVSELPVLGPAEARRLTVEWNATAAEYPSGVCLHRLIEERAKRSPDAPAVAFAGEELSFRELEGRANRLARHLRRLGVGPDSRVALLLERSLDAVVGVLGILKAGGAYVPLDPRLPRERIELVLADVEARAVLTHEALLAALPALSIPAVCLDRDAAELAAESEQRFDPGVAPENLAYVLYTSGSTGRPKGVMIPHASAVNLAFALRDAVYADQVGPLRISANAPLSFDASVKQLVQLVHGDAVCVLPEEVRIDGAALLAHLREQCIDVLDCTPGQLRLLLAAGLLDPEARHPRLLLVGGEAIDGPLWNALAATPHPVFYNVYGPTECTVDATASRIGGSAPTLGGPIPNVRVYVLDARGQLVPEGVPGELCIGGAGVGRGYLGRPEWTAERFVPDPFGAGEVAAGGQAGGGRLYRTGDLVRSMGGGKLEFIGRIDHQVKVRGFRIEPGEIEAALASHPGVAQAVVVAREETPGERRLVAYAVPRDRASLTTDGRHRHRLPNGLAVAHQNRNETDYLYEEIFEKRCYLRYGVELPEDPCILDVGANIGMFSLFASLLRPGCRIYAFEPIGPIHADLRANVELYNQNVRTFRFGLSETESTAHFSYYPRYSMMSGLSEYADPEGEVGVIKSFLGNEQASGFGAAEELLQSADELLAGRFRQELLECHLRRLSDVIREEGIGRVDLLKVDVQRAELDVLKGIDERDWDRIEQVVMEVHDAEDGPSAGRLREILDLLHRHGFEAVAEQDELLTGTDRHNLYAVRPRGGRRLLREPGPLPPPPPAVPADFDAGAVDAGELRDFLRSRLPEYMVPYEYVLLPELPLTRNGKVDRAALPTPSRTDESAAERAALRGPVEEVLAAIWTSLLQIDQVGADDDFFELGGHSLLVTQLVSRMREAFAVEVPIRTVFEASALRDMALRVEQAFGQAAPLPGVEPGPDGPAPLSFAQQRLWFLDRFEPGSPQYNSPLAARLIGPLDAAALAAALSEIDRRHEVLRTVFAEDEDGPMQVALPAAEMQLPVVDLSRLPAPVRAAEAERVGSAEARLPFDLAAGPVWRARLLRLADREHVALLSFHHIAVDGWSIGVFLRELTALYEACGAGRPSPLAELPLQYRDFARWQRQWLAGEPLERQLSFWRRSLAGLEVAELPADRPRPAAPSSRGAFRPLELSERGTQLLTEVARREGATVFMALAAALQALVARYTGREDVSLGMPIAGRNRAELEELIGFFVNTVVLRTGLAGKPTFRELLGREREVVLEAYRHQDLPFERLVDELQPERNLGHTPLFQVLFGYQREPAWGGRFGELELTPIELASGTTKFDLALSLTESRKGIAGRLDYRTELYDAATAERLCRHFQVLLEGALDDPGMRLSELPLLAASEHHQVVLEWNATAAPELLRAERLHELIEAQVDRTPEAVAVTCEGESLTYGELDRRANRLAHHLLELGVAPDVLVGVAVERSPELMVGLLAVLKAGGAYVPLDPSYPQERLAFMVEDARVPVLLTQDRLLGSVPAGGARVICLDTGGHDLAAQPGSRPRVAGSAESLAYCIYTSGSTGRPKGAVNSHRGIVNRLLWMQSQYGLRPGEGVLQKTPASFDVSVWELFWPLLAGARVVFARPGGHQDSAYLAELIGRERVTTLHFVPSMLQVFLEEPRLVECTCLLRVITSGEALPRELEERFGTLLGAGTELHNLYGPTEAAVDVTAWPCLREPGARSTPIGRPIANLRIHLLDPGSRPVPVGVPGHLHIGGAGLARGYLRRPDLTAERFVPDPFCGRSSPAGGRLYATGDLARLRPDGAIEFLGRLDHQVKIRGFRIELGEIENALNAHPAVREAAVLARPGGGSGEGARLVAYVVGRRPAAELATAATSATLEIDRLREFLAGRLPDYMVPPQFVVLDAFPLNPSGKVDRKALPAPDEHHRPAATPWIAPRTPVEGLLAGIWERVLGVDPVGVEDNFFALGGHSLLATRIVSRIRAAFAIDLPLRTMFEAPTVAALARAVEATRAAGVGLAAPPIESGPARGELPLSFAQQRLWFLAQLEPDSPAYNIPSAVRLSGRLDEPALAAALSELVSRHETLRTRFPAEDGRPRQEVVPPVPVPLPVVDLSPLPDGERETRVRALIAEEVATPFDLAVGPVLRARLLRLGEHEHVALLSFHHIVSDGWSVGIFLRELEALYGAFATGRPSSLPELPIQYRDFARWQRRWLQGEILERHLEHWRQRLSGLEVAELPADRPRSAVPSAHGDYAALALSKPAQAGLADLARSFGATPFMALAAALQALVARYTGREDVSLGTPIAGRHRAEVEGLIGFFVNTVVLRTDLAGDPTFRELLGREREAVLDAYQHQDLPFERLVDELQLERNLGHTPLFQVMFGYQREPEQGGRFGELELTPIDLASGTTKFDLALSLSEGGEGIAGRLEYRTELYDAATAERLCRHFQVLLEGALGDPGMRLSELPLLSGAEREQLWVGWGDRRGGGDGSDDLAARFAAQVRRAPDATALVVLAEDGGESLSYGELDRRSNRLAHRLLRQGAAGGKLVALCAERSADLVVGILGVLKTGAAWLALDPSYPEARLALLLEDSGAAVLVAREGLLATAPGAGIDRVSFAELAGEPATAPEVEWMAGDLAYVVYTSGTSGLPKGVMVERGQLANVLHASRERFGFSAADRMPCLAPQSFDIFLFELLNPLLCGGTVELVGLRPALDLPRLLVALEESTLLHAVPALMRQVVEAARGRSERYACLRGLFVGGDAVPAALLEDMREVFPQAQVWVLYGPTEATIICTSHAVAREGAAPTRIGRPLPGIELRLCDRWGGAVPVGAAGELWVGGWGVARGYLGHEELTTERFVERDGRRFYRTGDQARWLAAGELEFLGRVDQQVKVRGFRIEPGEVETALLRHPEVAEAVVVARADGGDKRLVAYVVARAPLTKNQLEAAALRAFLAGSLPDYMVPSAFVALDALPLTAHGKVDLRALPAPSRERAEPAGAPRSRTEAILARIWAEVLNLAAVGIDDNFFDLGGDSILSIQIVARANQAGLRLTPRQVFQHQTIAALAAVAMAGGAPVVDAEQGPVSGPAPLTPIQHHFLDGEPVDPDHFLQSLLFAVEGLDAALLEGAVAALVAHHDALRLRFVHADGVWGAVHAGLDGPVPFRRVDLSGVPEPERAATLERLLAEEQAALSISRGPLLRVALFDFGKDAGARLLLAAHHLVVDGVSWRILVEDLRTAHAQLARGEEVRLPPKTTAFGRWAERLAERALAPEILDQAELWAAMAAPPLAATPVDLADGAGDLAASRSVAVELPAEETGELVRLASTARAQVHEILLFAVARALTRLAGKREAILIDVEGHGREELFDDVDLTRTVGWFTSLFPLRVDPGPEGDLAAALARVRDQLRAVPDKGLGYGLLRHLGPVEVAARLRELPRPQVAFNYLGRFDGLLAEAGEAFRPAPEPTGPARSPRAPREHLLEVGAAIVAGRLSLTWTYSATAHQAATVQSLAESVLAILRELLSAGPAEAQPELLGVTPDELEAALHEIELEGI